MIRPLLLALFPALACAAPLPLYLGTQTGKDGGSQGIYSTTFDPDHGTFGEVKLAAKYDNPGFLALHPQKPLLYAVGPSTVAAFRISGPGTLEFLKDSPSGGKNACHLAVDATGHTIAVANYEDGRTSTLPLDAEGLPGAPVTVHLMEGSGPVKGRQAGPHAHGVYFTRDHRFLLVPDLGIDKLLVYPFNAKDSTFDSAKATHLTSQPGSGPRHAAFSPDEKQLYIIDELDSHITVAAFNAQTGSLKQIQRISTLPADWSGSSTTAEIAVHPNGRFVYGSNRGHDSIAIFSRDPETGKLTAVGHTPCGGKTPRHFTLSPDGKWLLCAHQSSNTLVAFPLDPSTGKLGTPTAPVTCPNPICILFAKS